MAPSNNVRSNTPALTLLKYNTDSFGSMRPDACQVIEILYTVSRQGLEKEYSASTVVDKADG